MFPNSRNNGREFSFGDKLASAISKQYMGPDLVIAEGLMDDDFAPLAYNRSRIRINHVVADTLGGTDQITWGQEIGMH